MQEAGSREGSGGPELAVLEGQLTWLVHVIGAVVRGRQSSSAAESQARPLLQDMSSCSPCRVLWSQHASLHSLQLELLDWPRSCGI